MKNVWKRVLLTCIAVPGVGLAIFFPMNNHLVLALIYGVVVTFFGSLEIGSIINFKEVKVQSRFLTVVNLYLFGFGYLWAHNFFGIDIDPVLINLLFLLSIVIFFALIFARDIFKKDLEKSFERIAYSIVSIIYVGLPSFVLPFILNVSAAPVNPHSVFPYVESHGTLLGSLLASYLLIIIWSNDIFAYVWGMLLGRNNKIGLSASPNKSWAGYIGGYFSTFIFVALFYFPLQQFLDPIPYHFFFIVPFFSGFMVPIGDLVESVIKRSVHVKDSGNLILGRGGVLDSVDTLLYVLPVYFIGLQIYMALFIK